MFPDRHSVPVMTHSGSIISVPDIVDHEGPQLDRSVVSDHKPCPNPALITGISALNSAAVMTLGSESFRSVATLGGRCQHQCH